MKFYCHKREKEAYEDVLILKSYELITVIEMLNKNQFDLALTYLDYKATRDLYYILGKKKNLNKLEKSLIEAHKRLRAKYPVKKYNGTLRNKEAIAFYDALLKTTKKLSKEKQSQPNKKPSIKEGKSSENGADK